MKYLSTSDVLFVHSALIDETGGSHGVRDMGLLESALAGARQSFGGQDLYPTLAEKAAALLSGIAKNHPFVDGNKRTAFTVMGVFLELNGKKLIASQSEAVEFVLELASGRFDVPKAALWLVSHLQ